jgi:hypothetical protein
MTKLEAIKAMQEGRKVTHRYFDEKEWVTMGRQGEIILEDGVECSPAEFWKWRTNPAYETDWEIYPVICGKCGDQLNGDVDTKCEKCGSYKKA